MVELRLENVTKEFGSETAVSDLSLSTDGDLLVLVGPSGCGKSTTLRMIAGLEQPTEGSIYIGGQDVTDLSPSDRSIAMVFQNYALYRTMNVRKNMGYGLKHSTSMSAEERRRKVEEIAAMFDITDLLNREIDELSGGQKQRVALGRALVRDPDVFLLDEPLSSLDAKLRSRMRTELQRIQRDLGVTTVYVTHDQKEAMTMGDELAVMNNGVLQQLGHPQEMYNRPQNRFVASFLGSPSMNLLPVTTTRQHGKTICSAGTTELVTLSDDSRFDDHDLVLGVRPEDIDLTLDSGDAPLVGTVNLTEYQGNDNFVQVEIEELSLTVIIPSVVRPEPGDRVGIIIPENNVHLFDADTGAAVRSASVDEQAPSATK